MQKETYAAPALQKQESLKDMTASVYGSPSSTENKYD